MTHKFITIDKIIHREHPYIITYQQRYLNKKGKVKKRKAHFIVQYPAPIEIRLTGQTITHSIIGIENPNAIIGVYALISSRSYIHIGNITYTVLTWKDLMSAGNPIPEITLNKQIDKKLTIYADITAQHEIPTELLKLIL